MRGLFDQGTPAPLRHALAPHEVSTAFELGWSNLENGDLLREAEGRFEVFVTTLKTSFTRSLATDNIDQTRDFNHEQRNRSSTQFSCQAIGLARPAHLA